MYMAREWLSIIMLAQIVHDTKESLEVIPAPPPLCDVIAGFHQDSYIPDRCCVPAHAIQCSREAIALCWTSLL